MPIANRRRSPSPPANRQRSCSPAPTASSPYLLPPRHLPRLPHPPTPNDVQPRFPGAAPPLHPPDRTQSHALFHLPLRRIHRFSVPHTSISDDPHRVVTESHSHTLGCRLTINDNYTCRLTINNNFLHVPNSDFSIIHLLTGEQTCLPNPRAAISRVLLFDDLVVAWSHYSRFYIQYYRLGGPRWRMATFSFANVIEDLIFVKGTLYALVNPGHRLAVVELPDDDDNNNLKLEFLAHQFDTQEHDESLFFLAECCSELLLVIWGKGKFLVLQWQAREGKWLRIISLGGCTVFFAGTRFSGCLGPNHPGIQGDCIYITHSTCYLVFSLIDGSHDTVSVPRQAESDCYWPSLWVFPSMC